MTHLRSIFAPLVGVSMLSLALVSGCGHGPTRTQTTTTAVSERPTEGGQTESRTTETVQVAEDGTQSTDTTGTSHVETPPPPT